MKKQIIALCLIGLALTACNKEKSVQLDSELKKESYANGYLVGSNIKPQLDYLAQYNVQIDAEAMIQGIKDSMLDKRALTEEEVQQFYSQLQNRLISSLNELRDKNLEAGAVFLKDNKSKSGVVALASGLQYKVVKKGSGAKPGSNDTVTVHYRGRFLDGNEFDSSYQYNQPVQFNLQQVIEGWTEALQLMPVGSTWEIYVPANLAYGDQGNGVIEPGKTLVFDIELISID